MHQLTTYTIILPAYQEADNLQVLLPVLKNVFSDLNCSYEIVVVDTVYPFDQTQEICMHEGVQYLHRQPKDTFGDAVRTGIQAAKGEWIIFMDADGSHTPEFIPKLIQYIPAYDVMIASRYVAGGATENNWILVLMSRIVNFSYSIVLNLKCKDVSNSFKVYRASIIKTLNLNCQNFDIVEEILFKICKKYPKARIKEVPFIFKSRKFGKTKRNLLSFSLTFLFTLVKLRFFT